MSDLIDRQKVLELPRDVTRNLQGEIVEESIDIEAIKSLPSVESEPKCNSCRYRNLEWYKEPCDSCTGGGESCHYKPEPERLTDDDFETIRIHLNAYKEKLCNQRRWEEAEEYQRIIDRFVSFASAESEIIRCKDCKYWTHIKRTNRYWCKTDDGLFDLSPSPDDFCSRAERRTE